MFNLNKVTVERTLWILLTVGLAYGSWYVVNYVRDHEEYKTAAAACETGKAAMAQQVEEAEAEVSRLKALPVR